MNEETDPRVRDAIWGSPYNEDDSGLVGRFSTVEKRVNTLWTLLLISLCAIYFAFLIGAGSGNRERD
jgi:hypothetical protein